MKKIFISILLIVTFSLVIGLSSSSNPVLANPQMDDLIVLEGDLANVDVEALVAEVIAEDSLQDVDEITDLIEETIASSRAVFILNQPSHLALFLDGYIASNGDTIILNSNINMTGFGPFAGRSSFDGIFNGNDFTISNLDLQLFGGNLGFIRESSQITLTNVTFENLQVNGSTTGGLIGILRNFGWGSSTIDNVHITENSVVLGGNTVGGFVGLVEDTTLFIQNSNNYSTVDHRVKPMAALQLGGFVGELVRSNLYIDNSENHGSVSGPTQRGVGGFIGRAIGDYSGPSIRTNHIEIFNSTNEGTITNSGGNSAGGFIGITNDATFNHLNITIENSENRGFLSESTHMGGFIGFSNNLYSQISLIDVCNSGDIDGSRARSAGGIIGYIFSDRSSSAYLTLINVCNSVDISASTYTGGIIGFMAYVNGEIRGAINTGDCTGSFNPTTIDGVGGIIGFIGGSNLEIQDAHNSGTIIGRRAGGILGAVYAISDITVTDWSNTGLIIGTGYAGQCVGDFETPWATVNCQ